MSENNINIPQKLQEVCGFAPKRNLFCPYLNCKRGKSEFPIKWEIGGNNHGNWRLILECDACKGKWSVCTHCNSSTKRYVCPKMIKSHEKKYHKILVSDKLVKSQQSNMSQNIDDRKNELVFLQENNLENETTINSLNLLANVCSNQPITFVNSDLLKYTQEIKNDLGLCVDENEVTALLTNVGRKINKPILCAVIFEETNTCRGINLLYDKKNENKSEMLAMHLNIKLAGHFENNHVFLFNIYSVEISDTVITVKINSYDTIVQILLVPISAKQVTCYDEYVECSNLYFAIKSDMVVDLSKYVKIE
jgi:hypothetical protein